MFTYEFFGHLITLFNSYADIQDDVVMGTLTVRENFMFSANLRRPRSETHKEKKQKVEETIVELGLTKCADSRVSHVMMCLCIY